MASISAEPASGSTVIALHFVSTDPQLAALGANTLARLYLAEQLETKQSASRRAREFLEVEIERLRAQRRLGRAGDRGLPAPGRPRRHPARRAAAHRADHAARADPQRARGGRSAAASGAAADQLRCRSRPGGADAGVAGAQRAAGARGRAQPPARRAVDRVRRAPSAHAEPALRAGRARGAQARRDPPDHQPPQRRGAGAALARGDARGQHRRPQGADGGVPGGRDRARRAAARRRRRPRPARDLHQPRQGDRLAAEGAGARRADHLARGHARRADLPAPRA